MSVFRSVLLAVFGWGAILALCAALSSAGLPPTSTKGSGESAYVTTFKFEMPNFAVTRSGTTVTLGVNSVAGGGTGASTLTANNVLLGNGTSAVQFVAPGTSGNVLTSNGTTWTSAAPSGSGGGTLYGTLYYPGTTNCRWSGTAGTFSAFSADTDCGTPVATGGVEATTTKIPGIRMQNLPADTYLVIAQFRTATSGSAECQWTLYDGSARSASLSSNADNQGITLLGDFTYGSTQSDLTIEIRYAKNGGTNCEISAEVGAVSRDLFFWVIRL